MSKKKNKKKAAAVEPKAKAAKKSKKEKAAPIVEAADDQNELNLEFADDEESAEVEMSESGDSEVEASESEDNEIEASESDETEIEAGKIIESDDLEFLNEVEEGGELSASSESDEMADDSSGDDDASEDSGLHLENTELGAFESAQIEDIESLPNSTIRSIVESVLFTTDKPISIALIKQAFKGTNVKSKDIREALTWLADDYLNSDRGFTLDEIAGGFQLRTKPENVKYLRQSVKARPFKLSGPALEVLSIVAYKQPTTKHQIDEIRGVESGHLLRALMEKHLLTFGERSDLPGKPMFYETTRKFLEIFGLRNLQELPSLHEIDQLIPEGIGAEEAKKETLSDLTGQLSQEVASSYSVGEDELLKITDELSTITTSSDFFEQEKQRMRMKRDEERAQSIREAQIIGEAVEAKDLRWLERFEASKLAAEQGSEEVEFVTEGLTEGAEASEAAPVVDGEAAEMIADGHEDLEIGESEEDAGELEAVDEIESGDELEASDDLKAAEESEEMSADAEISLGEEPDPSKEPQL